MKTGLELSFLSFSHKFVVTGGRRGSGGGEIEEEGSKGI